MKMDDSEVAVAGAICDLAIQGHEAPLDEDLFDVVLAKAQELTPDSLQWICVDVFRVGNETAPYGITFQWAHRDEVLMHNGGDC